MQLPPWVTLPSVPPLKCSFVPSSPVLHVCWRWERRRIRRRACFQSSMLKRKLSVTSACQGRWPCTWAFTKTWGCIYSQESETALASFVNTDDFSQKKIFPMGTVGGFSSQGGNLGSFFKIFKIFIYLFWGMLSLHCCTWAFSSCSQWWEGYSSCSLWASQCSGFSCCGTGTQRHKGFSSYGARVWLPCGLWNLPWPGSEPVSSALAGRFLTTRPPGKSPPRLFVVDCNWGNRPTCSGSCSRYASYCQGQCIDAPKPWDQPFCTLSVCELLTSGMRRVYQFGIVSVPSTACALWLPRLVSSLPSAVFATLSWASATGLFLPPGLFLWEVSERQESSRRNLLALSCFPSLH